MRWYGIALLGHVLLSARAYGQQPFDLDETFQTTMLEEVVNSVVPLADGRVLVAGSLSNYPGSGQNKGIARLQANGWYDISFAANNYVQADLTLWNDRIYGRSETVFRFLSDGTLDPDFIPMNTGPYFVAIGGGDYFVYPDGRILLSGTHVLHDSIRGFEGQYNLTWFSNQGYLDTTAHHRTCDGTGHIAKIFPLPDGRFMLAGLWSSYEGVPTPNSERLIRVFADGALDTTFHSPFNWSSPDEHLLLPDGKHLLTGLFRVNGSTDTLQIIRLTPNGDIDDSFNWHIQLKYAYDVPVEEASIAGIYRLDDERLIITGAFTEIDGQVRGGIAVIDTAGNPLDDYFVSNGCGAWFDGFDYRGKLSGIVPAPDGGYYIHGSYRGYDDGTVNDVGQKMVSHLYGLDVGVEDQVQALLALFPVPGTSDFTVRMAASEAAVLSVFDPTGRLVKHERCMGPSHHVRTGALRAGAYLVRLAYDGGKTGHGKWIKAE
jgi:uncharacterized delta-60 repeat protein